MAQVTSYTKDKIDELIAAIPTAGGGGSFSGGVANGVTATLLITPVGADDNGIIVKAPNFGWGANGVAAGPASPYYATGQYMSFIRDGGATAADSTMWRVDRTGGTGLAGGLHIATGLRNNPGYTASQCVWITPYLNTYGIIIQSPQVVDAPVWDKSFFLAYDVRTSTTMFELTSTGNAEARGDVTARKGLSTEMRIGDNAGVPSLLFGPDDLLYLYREGAVIRTSGGLGSNLYLTAYQGSALNQVVIGAGLNGPTVAFHNPVTAEIYSPGADSIRTPGAFDAVMDITAGLGGVTQTKIGNVSNLPGITFGTLADTALGRVGVGVARMINCLEFKESASPGVGGLDTVRLFAQDNGAGKTRLMAQFNTGAPVQVALQP